MILEDIFLFNHRLNDYEYIIPNNGNIITQIKEHDFDKYKYLTPLEFEKYRGGICWDYVTYQAYYFKKYFPSIEYKIFFKCFINDEDNPTHSFMIFKYHNTYYWFESSWKNEKGIKSYKSEKSAINDIMNRMKMFDRRSFKKEFLIEYNPLNPVLFGMNHNQIMNYIYNIVKMNRLKLMESVLNTHQLIQERSDNIKLYFLTKVDMKDSEILQPRIPQNFLIDNGYEDGKTKRVCFSTSINGALMGLSQNLKNTDLYVYQPEGIVKSDIYKPSLTEVPDKSITGEVWIKRPVNIKFIGKIHVKDAKNKPYKYKYGNKTAELYDWNWEWIDKNINESVITNNDDFYFDYDKFKSGSTNILFITGLTGSGKSTIGRSLSNKHNATYVELDRMDPCTQISIKSLDELKNSPKDKLIYEYLSKNKKTHEKLKSDNISNTEIFLNNCKFIQFIKSYANSHPNEKFVVEGLQIYEYCKIKNTLLKPIIIKGTSVLTSFIRKIKRENWTMGEIIKYAPSTVKRMVGDNKILMELIKSYKDDKNINESVTSILNKIHSSRSKLNKYNSESLTIDILNKYKKQYRNLSHVKINDSTDGRIYTDNGKVVAMVNTQKKADGSIWIQGLEVFGEYRGQELSYGLLDIAVRELRSNYLSVRKTNSKAIKLYNNYGFITYKQDNYMQYMRYRSDNMYESTDVTIDIKTYTSDTDIRQSKKDVINIQSTFSQKERKLMGLDSNEKIKEKVIAKFIAKVDNVPVAYFSLQDVGPHINASVGTRNGDKFRGHGYATQCIKEGLKWYKNNKHKFKNKLIVWWAEKENIGSQKTAEKAGFTRDLSINKSNDDWLKNNWCKYIYR